MARRLHTVNDLIGKVRHRCDEDNNDTLSDNEILEFLNAAQDHAVDILSVHYPEPYLKFIEFEVTADQQDYPIPEDSYSDKVTKVEFKSSTSDNYYQEVERINYRDITVYDNADSTVFVPYNYYIVGNNVRFVPHARGTCRMWYIRMPDELIESWGRITSLAPSSQKLVVDSLSTELTTTVDDLFSFFNVIDGQTGVVKASFQAKNITNNTVQIKQIVDTDIDTGLFNFPGRTLYTSLTDPVNADGSQAIRPGDYICAVEGTCVPYFSRPAENFILEMTVAQAKRKLGHGAADMEERLKKDFESQLVKTWTGREQKLRVKKTSSIWNNTRRLYKPFSRN